MVLGEIVLGLYMVAYFDYCGYRIFKDRFSFLKNRFDDVKINEEVLKKIAEKNLIEENKGIFNSVKNHIVENYNSVLEMNVPKYLMFSRPGFYFDTKKELAGMKEESERRLKGLEMID